MLNILLSLILTFVQSYNQTQTTPSKIPTDIAIKQKVVGEAFPEYKDFEKKDCFAGCVVKNKVVGDNYYFAYLRLGSGVPIAGKTCFKVDKNNRVTEIIPTENKMYKVLNVISDVDPQTCIGYTGVALEVTAFSQNSISYTISNNNYFPIQIMPETCASRTIRIEKINYPQKDNESIRNEQAMCLMAPTPITIEAGKQYSATLLVTGYNLEKGRYSIILDYAKLDENTNTWFSTYVDSRIFTIK